MMAKVDEVRSMNAIINHQIRIAKTELKRNPSLDLRVQWQAAMQKLVRLSLANPSFPLDLEIDELIRRSRGRPWAFERFRNRVLAP